MGQQRQRAVNNLLTTQFTVTEELRSGVETYMEPLVSILPSETYQRMFAGLKQVLLTILFLVLALLIINLFVVLCCFNGDYGPVEGTVCLVH